MSLFSSDISEREKAASRYRVFPEPRARVPKYWHEVLEGRELEKGRQWPKKLRSQVTPRKWPKHAAGTANAACMLLWHRPGVAKNMDHTAGDYIKPHTPNLGGIGHAHNVLWHSYHSSPSWFNIHKFIPTALGAVLENPWSQLMIVNINPVPGKPSKIDRLANLKAVSPGDRLDIVVNVCQPLVLLACGVPAKKAIQHWSNPKSIPILETSHPLKWNGHGGVSDGPKVVEALQTLLNIK